MLDFIKKKQYSVVDYYTRLAFLALYKYGENYNLSKYNKLLDITD